MTTPRPCQMITAPGPTFVKLSDYQDISVSRVLWSVGCWICKYKCCTEDQCPQCACHCGAHPPTFYSINVSLQWWTQCYLQSEGLLLLQICHAMATLCHWSVARFVASFQLSYCKIYSQVPPSSMQADLPTTEHCIIRTYNSKCCCQLSIWLRNSVWEKRQLCHKWENKRTVLPRGQYHLHQLFFTQRN
jgi:hypothetical protein